nr:proteasome subunit alpha type-4 [Seculamonas ecuadoriensis]
MSRRYDSKTTMFSPEGRLFQVEYAMAAIGEAGLAMGVLSRDGVVLAGEKKVVSELLDNVGSPEKMYKIDDHIAVAVAGLTSDASILVNQTRLAAQRYRSAYQESIPVEQLIQQICDTKQGYTQYGGLRPFGVSMLYAGWDKHFGFQLYHSDPSGNYGGWKAYAIGAHHQGANSILKQEWTEDLSLRDAMKLVVKVMSKTMDTASITSEKLEFATVTRADNKVEYRNLNRKEVDALLSECDITREAEEP